MNRGANVLICQLNTIEFYIAGEKNILIHTAQDVFQIDSRHDQIKQQLAVALIKLDLLNLRRSQNN